MAIFFKDGSPAEVQVLQDRVLWAQPGLGDHNSLPRDKNRELTDLKRLLCKVPQEGLQDRTNCPFCVVPTYEKLYSCIKGKLKSHAAISSSPRPAVLKVWSVNSQRSPRPFQGVHEVKNHFHNNAKRLFAFSLCVDICTDCAKAMVGNCWHLRENQGSGPRSWEKR